MAHVLVAIVCRVCGSVLRRDSVPNLRLLGGEQSRQVSRLILRVVRYLPGHSPCLQHAADGLHKKLYTLLCIHVHIFDPDPVAKYNAAESL